MKKPILFLLFIAVSLFSNAQNYEPLQAGVKRFFSDGYYLRGMRIDSIVNAGADKIYYPFRSPRGHYTNLQVLNPNGGSWLGKSVIKQPDGTFWFDNLWQDTIVIKTQAILNDSWVMYADASSVYYTATLTSLDTMTVLGNIDSVKKIIITAYDNNQVLTSDPINNAEIILSKNYGFVKTLDLYTFPYHGPGQVAQTGFDYFLDIAGSSPFYLIDFHEPTLLQVYDFEPGDVFGKEAYGLNGLPSWWTDSVISKNLINSSLVEYVIQTNKKAWQNNNTPAYTTTIHTLTVTSAPIFTIDKMPEEWGCNKFYYYSPLNTSHCYVSPAYTIKDNFIGVDGVVYSYGQCGLTSIYKEKFGQSFYLQCFSLDPGDSESEWMEYSKKNGQPCGTVPPVVGVGDINAKLDGLTIYPNPATNALFIQNELQATLHFSLLNIYGQPIHSASSSNKLVTISIGQYPTGIYFLKVSDGDGAAITRKIQVQH